MDAGQRKSHWETVYLNSPLETAGWYQPVPHTSLELICERNLPVDAPVIDVGGGDSYLAEHLCQSGFTDLTVLDISGASLERARQRMGRGAEGIRWVESDILSFIPDRSYQLWHDRATFHFLTTPGSITRYLETAHRGIQAGGYLILGTFSEKGPQTCSGLPVKRYAISDLRDAASPHFTLLKGINLPHYTPSGVKQDYSFGVFVHSG